MDKLTKIRTDIEETDRKMARLFEKRMGLSAAVAEYKKERNIPVKDSAREKLLMEKNCGYINDPVLKGYYEEFLREIIDISCRYQETLLL